MVTRFMVWLTALMGLCAPVSAKDYLVTASHPNSLHLIDVKARTVVRSMPIPGDGAPVTISTTPTGKVAYVLTNHLESVAGIDLETGEQVFRADFSEDDTRIKSISAMTVGGDGRELFVFQSPVRLSPSEYQVMDTRIAVYDTSAGVDAKPVRSFPAPRGIMQLLSSPDGATLYAFGFDIHTLDARTGESLATFKMRGWDRPNLGQPDILTMWTAPDMSGIYAAAYAAPRTDMNPTDPMAWHSGLMLLDLATGAIELRDFERGGPITFSAVVNPVRRNEVYSIYLMFSKLDLSRAIDLDANPTDSLVVKRLGAPHTYYNINISSDGEEIYLGGTMDDIAIHGTAEMDARGTIKLPGGGDMALGFLKMVKWGDAE
ncbi:MAG: quinohemoprotein amine dehydrogenase subunit beta [Sphingomonadales bacterium]